MGAEKFDSWGWLWTQRKDFLKYEKCNSIFYASNNNNIKELGKVMILERKGSISQVI